MRWGGGGDDERVGAGCGRMGRGGVGCRLWGSCSRKPLLLRRTKGVRGWRPGLEALQCSVLVVVPVHAPVISSHSASGPAPRFHPPSNSACPVSQHGVGAGRGVKRRALNHRAPPRPVSPHQARWGNKGVNSQPPRPAPPAEHTVTQRHEMKSPARRPSPPPFDSIQPGIETLANNAVLWYDEHCCALLLCRGAGGERAAMATGPTVRQVLSDRGVSTELCQEGCPLKRDGSNE